MNVDPTSLRALATNCQGWSAELAASAPGTSFSSPSQATAAAVAAVNADAALASTAFSERMKSTATKLVDSGVGYSSNEEESASRLTNLTAEL
jgi:hypothetical protein